ncbi:ATP-dependent DNA helicase [Haematospirillum jordaniae]|uniref:ATP-dependent DNA helicase n=1 Tax=Haematospirillum jordaniae TaxID=1549855 RepID=UPI0038D09B88
MVPFMTCGHPDTLELLLPDAPVLVAGAASAVVLTPDGEILTLDRAAAVRWLASSAPPLVCHAPAVAARLGCASFPACDVLELYAFVRPAVFCLPTVAGLAAACHIALPAGPEQEATALSAVVVALLRDLSALSRTSRPQARALAWGLLRAGWPWARCVLHALGETGDPPHSRVVAAGFRVWESLPEISEHAPEPSSSCLPVSPTEARARLAQILGGAAEDRPQQADFASACCEAFEPRDAEGEPRFVLAEAGTGVGKTLGYVAPASLWAEKNGGAVWLSTYTRNLQRQLEDELARLYPDPREKARHVVVRKGRENYLCLLNLEEAAGRLSVNPARAVALGLVARWALATRDGAMIGGDFPGWLVDILGRSTVAGLTDRRGECVFTACPHYNRCFVERSVRKARRARIVVANHALVMRMLGNGSAASGGDPGGGLPVRYVFDEGHHVFEAADGAFSAHLGALETAELRRWILGAEEGTRSRARGLQRRAEECVQDDPAAQDALDAILQGARCLPGPGWMNRLGSDSPHGPAERFLHRVRQQVYARSQEGGHPYSLEADVEPPVPGLTAAAAELERALETLSRPVQDLMKALAVRLDADAAELDASVRLRMEGLIRSLERRVLRHLSAWRAMLDSLQTRAPETCVDWFAVERLDGRDFDVGMRRHWIDPTLPFAQVLQDAAHGVLVASATLRDGSGDPAVDWKAAEARTGAAHLSLPAVRAAVASPFDYAGQTRVLVVTDVRRDDAARVAAAFRSLFLASGGGGLGLFTAVSRLRAVYERIMPAMAEHAIPLYAQHVSGMDTATLVDLFRADEPSCLLGTDALRDGMDVPGRALRLVVFDRVPWPRPDILHRVRRKAFGGRDWDDRLTRLRLKQAFGRLVRRADDRGVFVLLDPLLPSRLHGAFPPGTEVRRLGLADAVREVSDFLGPVPASPPPACPPTA